MNKYEELVMNVIKEEFMAKVPCDESDAYELLEGLDRTAQTVYDEFIERDDCTTIFDIKKIFEERGWL